MSIKLNTRVLLRPEWQLHIGHLGSIYFNQSLIQENNSNLKDSSGKCYIFINDMNSDSGEDFINDLKWLNLANTQIVQMSKSVKDIRVYLYRLIKDGHIYIENYYSRTPVDVEEVYIRAINGESTPNTIYPLKFRLKLPHSGSLDSKLSDNSPQYGVQELANSSRSGVLEGANSSRSGVLEGAMPSRYGVHEGSPLVMIQKNRYTEPQMSLNFSIIALDLFYKINLLVDSFYKHKITDEVEIMYNWMFKYFKTALPKHINHHGYKLLDFHYDREQVVELIERKCFDGVDDPRLLTIAGLRRRGIPQTVLREFCLMGNRKTKIGLCHLDHLLLNYLPNLPSVKLVAIIDPVKINLSNFRSGETEYFITSSHQNDEYTDSSHLIPLSNTLYISKSDNLPSGQEIELNHGLKIMMLKKPARLTVPPGLTAHPSLAHLIQDTDELYAQYLGIGAKKTVTTPPINWISPDLEFTLNNVSNMQRAEFNLYDKWYRGELVNNFATEFGYKTITGFIDRKTVSLDAPLYYLDKVGYFSLDKTKTTTSTSASASHILSFNKLF